jgi:hypothetical protein
VKEVALLALGIVVGATAGFIAIYAWVVKTWPRF